VLAVLLGVDDGSGGYKEIEVGHGHVLADAA